MDPLTHTLVGANLAATRLGATTRFAAAALVVGANLPDVDAILWRGTGFGGELVVLPARALLKEGNGR